MKKITTLLTLVLTALLTIQAVAKSNDSIQSENSIIGYVQQSPINESQINSSNDKDRADQLRALFITPVINNFLETHKNKWALTKEEIKVLTQGYRNLINCQLKSNPNSVLQFNELKTLNPDLERNFLTKIGENKKSQKFIYNKFGGGRILFQQFTGEALDATLKLILDLEKKGAFEFLNPIDRDLALSYWKQANPKFILADPGENEAFSLYAIFPKQECTTE